MEELFGELRWAGHEIIRRRVQEYGIRCDLKFGYLDVAIKQRHMHEFEADYDRMQKAGFPHEFQGVGLHFGGRAFAFRDPVLDGPALG